MRVGHKMSLYTRCHAHFIRPRVGVMWMTIITVWCVCSWEAHQCCDMSLHVYIIHIYMLKYMPMPCMSLSLHIMTCDGNPVAARNRHMKQHWGILFDRSFSIFTRYTAVRFIWHIIGSLFKSLLRLTAKKLLALCARPVSTGDRNPPETGGFPSHTG